MKIGYVYFSAAERNRVANAIRNLQNPGAIDELGIGRVRDAFGEMLFPGISTLQNHAKYFVLLPHLYRLAIEEGVLKSPEHAKEVVRKKEILLTKRLKEGSAKNTTGITGSDSVDSDTYVRYDPTYIYWSGLQSLGIVKVLGSIYDFIYNQSKKVKPASFQSKKKAEDEQSDDVTCQEWNEFLPKPPTKFDLNKKINIKLNKAEAVFLKKCITVTSEKTKNSLFAYILADDRIKQKDCFLNFDISQIKDLELRKQIELAQRFSRFMRPVHIYYNKVFAESRRNPNAKVVKELENKFNAELNKNKDVYSQKKLDEIFVFLGGFPKGNPIRKFCSEVLQCIKSGKKNGNFSKLKNLLVSREKNVKKPAQCKLSNPKAFEYDSKHPIHNYYLTYRWETAWIMIEEIRAGLNKKG